MVEKLKDLWIGAGGITWVDASDRAVLGKQNPGRKVMELALAPQTQ